MASETNEKGIDEIRKNIDSGKLVLGKNTLIKNLKKGKLAKVFLSSNCPTELKNDAVYYAKIAKVAVVELGYPNEELGTICKKPFSVSALGLLK